MKKIIKILCCFGMFGLCGCTSLYNSPAEMIERVRNEIPISNRDQIKIEYDGMIQEGNQGLLWYRVENGYYPVECSVRDDGRYEYVRMDHSLERLDDVGIVEWNDCYVFCVNQRDCKMIRIVDDSGTYEIKIGQDEYPYIFKTNGLPVEYRFYDCDGDEIWK